MASFYACAYVCMFHCIALVVENLSVHFNESLWWLTLNEKPQTKYRKIRATCETLALIASEIFAIQVQYVEQVCALGVVISIYIETNYCRIVLLNTAPTTEIPHNRGMDGQRKRTMVLVGNCWMADDPLGMEINWHCPLTARVKQNARSSPPLH